MEAEFRSVHFARLEEEGTVVTVTVKECGSKFAARAEASLHVILRKASGVREAQYTHIHVCHSKQKPNAKHVEHGAASRDKRAWEGGTEREGEKRKSERRKAAAKSEPIFIWWSCKAASRVARS